MCVRGDAGMVVVLFLFVVVCGKESENVGGAELGGWEVLIKRSGNRAGPIRPICNEHKRCIHVSYTIEMYNRVCT